MSNDEDDLSGKSEYQLNALAGKQVRRVIASGSDPDRLYDIMLICEDGTAIHIESKYSNINVDGWMECRRWHPQQ
jgi:hypothetical protein